MKIDKEREKGGERERERDRDRERGLLVVRVDFRGRERKTLGGLGYVNQPRGPSAVARQARGPSAGST